MAKILTASEIQCREKERVRKINKALSQFVSPLVKKIEQFIKEQQMKSDLKGKFDYLEPGTLYIDRRAGVVVLTSTQNPTDGMVVHVAGNCSKFHVGEKVHYDDELVERLGGIITLKN